MLKSMLIYIGEYKELCPNHQDFPSIKDHLSNGPYKGQGKIIHYLRKGGVEDMISMAIRKDIFTGKPLMEEDVGRNDGEFTWWTSLAYYVEKYNLRLPEKFEKKILG